MYAIQDQTNETPLARIIAQLPDIVRSNWNMLLFMILIAELVNIWSIPVQLIQ